MARSGKFLFGAIVGALFGLAFAPKKGSELRNELKTELEKGGKGEKTLKKNAAIMGKDIAETAKEVYEDPAVQTQVKRGQKEAEKIFNQAKENVESTKEEWVKMARSKIGAEGRKTLDTLKSKVEPLKKAVKKAMPAKKTPKKK